MSHSLESYINVQDDLKDKILKGKINFLKAKTRTKAFIETRLENLESQWTLFANTHRKIVYEYDKKTLAQTEYSSNDVYDLVENEYIEFKTVLKEALEKMIKVKHEEPRGESRNVFVKLPEISLPKFSGKYSEWANYKDMFKSLIHNNRSLEDVQRLHYLKGSLTGEAENLVKTISITADNYAICWNRLVARYDNKRSLANSIIRRLMSQKSLTQESAIAIRQLLDTTSECLQSLRNLGVSVNSWDLILIYIVSQKLDPESRAKWETKMCESSDKLPTYTQLEEFLEKRFRSLEYKLSEKNQGTNVPTTVKSNTATATSASISCLFCSEKHKLHNCKNFTREPVETRRHFVQSHRLCFNCFSPDHSVYTCTVSTSCHKCKKRHHTLLHPRTPPPVGKPEAPEAKKVLAVVTEATSSSADTRSLQDEPLEVLTSCFSTSRSTVLLATALVHARAHSDGSAGVLRSLLDQGSQASFVTESAVQLLGLRKSKEFVQVSGLGGTVSLKSKSFVRIRLTSRCDPSYSLQVKAHVLDKLTSLLPSNKVSIDISQLPFSAAELADPHFYQPSGIDLLLGAEVYSQVMMGGLVQGSNGRFIAQQTKLGWILSGVVEDSVPSNDKDQHFNCHTVTINEIDTDALLKSFWELESEPTLPGKILTSEEKACEELFAATTKRDESGRYIVKLPFKDEDPASKHGGSKNIAHKRFLMLEKRLLSNPTLKDEYSNVLKEYLDLGHMEICNDINKPDAVYLPHHAVIRSDKDTTKVRVVFDASCKGLNGASLNSDMLVGPTLQPELRHLIMKWRCHPISLVADIVKMYRQVKVTQEDADFQRILWRENTDEPIQHYRLLRVTFGTSSAPYLAVRALQQVARDEGAEFPNAAPRVFTDFYVDDLMTGCHSVGEGIQVYQEMTKLLGRAGFPLQKWSSNSKELLDSIGENRAAETVELKTDEIMKILGLTWNKETDEFIVHVHASPLSDLPATKRKVISDIAKLFDPLGWLAPSIMKAKIFIQKLWLSGIGWDDQLPSDLLQEWLDFRRELCLLQDYAIPRWIRTSANDKLFELHGFSDASNVAYAAVVYVRVVDEFNNVHVRVVTSKTRVAPIKQVSIPRLELCGATLLAKLLQEVGTLLNVPKQHVHAWSDSTIVLAWLSSHPSRWKTFVANRVSDILTIMDGNQWCHVSSDENPADCASRGLQPSEFISHHLWRQGPQFLHNISIDYNRVNAKDTHLEEKKKVNCHVATDQEPNGGEELLSRFSSLQKLLRVVSFCRRVLRWKMKKSETENSTNLLDNGLTVREIGESLLTCIKVCQGSHFQEEIACLKSSKRVGKKSKLCSLNPYLDENNILRVGGRLQNADIQDYMKNPIVIPHKSHFTNLLISDAHHKTMHGGSQLMLNFLRSKYWIIGAKSLVRQFRRKCVTCVRHSNQLNQQMMGQLPAARVTTHRPFYKTGVDYAGPIQVQTTKGRGHRSTKGYICVFVCMATKAVHLEVVSDMTSDAFLAAFKRFVARRGHVAEMWSDNGTTFVGAARQLAELLDVESSAVAVEILNWMSSNGTAWHFIPPHSPNFGGLWEAAVKSTKSHLIRVIGTTTLTFEELTTVLAQIEACLNSRPMSQLSSDPFDPSPLTPGHFLVGEPLVLVPELNYETANIGSLKRWHLLQKMTQDFWRRWSQEYLTQLQHRYKWLDQIPELGVGDVVLVKEDNLPPARWLYGRVVEKFPGSDKLTRVVALKYKDGIIKRPVSKLIVLPKD